MRKYWFKADYGWDYYDNKYKLIHQDRTSLTSIGGSWLLYHEGSMIAEYSYTHHLSDLVLQRWANTQVNIHKTHKNLL
jgi:hypothetical protein